MASTITNLINTIDTTFPVSGKNNDSQGFRTNFSIIQSALLNTESELETIQTILGTQGPTNDVNSYNVTGTHVTAVNDLTIGGSNVITVGNNYSTVITAGGGSGNIVMAANTVTTTAVDFIATNATTATSIYLTSTAGILTSATFTVGTTGYTATSVDYVGNLIAVSPSVSISDLQTVIANQTSITFLNPLIPGQPSVNTFINRALAGNVTIGGDLFVNGVLSGGGFLNSLATNGYQQLPGGMIMQWGQTNVLTTDSTTISFPIPFPNQCFIVIPAQYDTDTGSVNNVQTSAYRGAGPITSFNMFARGTERAAGIGWMAIGH